MLSPTAAARRSTPLPTATCAAKAAASSCLKRLSDALADGDRVLAVIRGSAVNQDGRSSGLTVPNGPAQQAVIREALAGRGSMPRTGRLRRGARHRHAARRSDRGAGARRPFCAANRPADRPLLVGSVKTNIGHLEAAAGIAGLIKVVLALQHERDSAASALQDAESARRVGQSLPISVPTRLVPWPASDRPRIAGVSSFGFSGTNAHVIVEEAPAAADDRRGPGRSTASRAGAFREERRALDELAARYVDRLRARQPRLCRRVPSRPIPGGRISATAWRVVARSSDEARAASARRPQRAADVPCR